MLRWAYRRSDGGVAIVTAMPRDQLEAVAKFITDQEYLEFVRLRSIPEDATDVVQLPDNWSPPTERLFRDSWVISGGLPCHDMGKCRDIWRDEMREARKPKLETLDIEMQRALGVGDAAKRDQVEARKQVLRDVPADPAIDTATTLDELKAVWPAELGARP